MKKYILLLIIFIVVFPNYDYSQNIGQDNLKPRYNNVFRIEISRSTFVDEAVVGFFAGALFVFDPYDTGKMLSSDVDYPQTYLKTSDNVDVAVDGLPVLVSNNECIAPLCFRTLTAGTFTYTATNLADFDSNISVYLEDIELNVLQDLRTTNTYVFTSGVITTTTRFKLHFITPVTPLLNWLGNTTDWNDASNWNTGTVPTSGSDVYISSVPSNQPHVTNSSSSPSLCNTLTIYSGATLTIDAGKALTATGTVTNSGTFNIMADATGSGSFIDDGLSTVTANMERYVKDNGSSRWEYVSSPVASQSSTLFSSASHGLWKADETTDTWINIPFATPENMNPVQGYARLYKSADADANTTKTATGTLNTGTQLISVTNTIQGFNLVGNPYPSRINWDAATGWTKTGIDDAVYYRTDGTAYSYIAGIGTGTATQYIPPMQAYWIHVTAAGTYTLQCDNNVRTHVAQNIYKTTSNNTLHLTVNNNINGLNDDTYIRFMSTATDSFDTQYDAYKLFAQDTAYPQVYTKVGNNLLSINSLSDLAGERTIPLGFNTANSGQFTLTAGNVSSFTLNGNTVYFEDLQTGTYQDLSVNGTYQFSSPATSGLNRFIVHFNPSVTGINESSDNPVQLYAVNYDLHITSSSALNGDVIVYDMLGQIIVTRHISGTSHDVISLDPRTSIYIIKYISGKEIITKKIIIR